MGALYQPYRCGQPAQQHGRRIPCESFEIPFSMRVGRVSGLAPDVIQQIHSLRASGVVSFQTASAFFDARRALRRSEGIVWTTVVVTTFIPLFYSSFRL